MLSRSIGVLAVFRVTFDHGCDPNTETLCQFSRDMLQRNAETSFLSAVKASSL